MDEKHVTGGDVERSVSESNVGAVHAADIDQRILKHSHDADEAMKAFTEAHGEVAELDEETNRRLLRKIDWHLMPIMCAVYGLNYLDKTTISYASVMGMKTDIGLVGDDYQWLGERRLLAILPYWLYGI